MTCQRLAPSETRWRTRPWTIAVMVLAAVASATRCNVNAALEEVVRARHLAANLHVQFTTAADASNKAVMADTDEVSIAFAREAVDAKEDVQRTVDTLRPILQNLRYADEVRLLDEFSGRFAEYREIDRRILELAGENTNVKARRLSFGPAFEAADAFSNALADVSRSVSGRNAWHVRALAAAAVAGVREIQALQAPHIAEAAAAAMTEGEARMHRAEVDVRAALDALEPLAEGSRARLDDARARLDRFVQLSQQITQLSRRNTNVRSMVLSLNEKTKIAAICEATLRDLRDALAKRGFSGTR